jgi:penicillin amidase
LFTSYLKRGDAHRLLVDQLLDDPNNPVWDDPGTGQQETRDDRVAKAYMEGVDWLGSQFGDWPPDWHWGRLHTATFAHPFGSIKPLDLIFNFGPIGVPGDSYTVFNTGFDLSKPYSDQTVSSMREIIDLSNLDGSWWIQTTGESGQPLNSHYTDLTPMWRDGKYAPLYFTREAVEKIKSGDLILEP